MADIKEVKDFATGVNIKKFIEKEMQPIIRKFEDEIHKITEEAQSFREKADQVNKFATQKEILERNIKELQKNILEYENNSRNHKNEVEIMMTKMQVKNETLKEQFKSLVKTNKRKQELAQIIDEKYNKIVNSMGKQQQYIDQKLLISDNKFLKLTKDTLKISGELKVQFQRSKEYNQHLKNQLVFKIKKTQEFQKIIDLYVHQREVFSQKICELEENLKQCIKLENYQHLKKSQQSELELNLQITQKMLEKYFSKENRKNIEEMHLRFAQIDEISIRLTKMQEVKKEINKISLTIEKMQKQEEQFYTQIKSETIEIEEKIEKIDKKFETIEQQVDSAQKNSDNLDFKLEQLKKYLEEQIIIVIKENQLKQQNQRRSLASGSKENYLSNNNAEEELEKVRIERERIQRNSQQILKIAEELNEKLNVFSFKITKCKSDGQIFNESMSKELKKITQFKRQNDASFQAVGKILSSFIEIFLIQTSLNLNQNAQPSHDVVYVSEYDGIVFEAVEGAKNSSKQMLNYRKKLINSADLRVALMYSLVELLDQTIVQEKFLKLELNRPSFFFQNNIFKFLKNTTNRAILSSPKIFNYSATIKERDLTSDDNIFDFKMENINSEFSLISTIKDNQNYSKNLSRLLSAKKQPTPSDKYFNNSIHKRTPIKLKNTQKEETEERSYFTASKSHRKSRTKYL